MHKRSVLNEGNDVDTTRRIPCCQQCVYSPKHTDSHIVAQIKIKVLKRQDLDWSEHGTGAPSGGWPMFNVHSGAGRSSATP